MRRQVLPPSHRRGCKRAESVCAPPLPLSTSFTTQLIRLAALGNSAMLIQGPHSQSSLAHACPELPFFSLQIKCIQKDFLCPKDMLSLPHTHPKCCGHLLRQLPQQGNGPFPTRGEDRALCIPSTQQAALHALSARPFPQLAAVLTEEVSQMRSAAGHE